MGSMAGEPRPPVEDAPSWPQPPSILQQRRQLVSSCLPQPSWVHLDWSLDWILQVLLAPAEDPGWAHWEQGLCILLLVLSLTPLNNALPT